MEKTPLSLTKKLKDYYSRFRNVWSKKNLSGVAYSCWPIKSSSSLRSSSRDSSIYHLPMSAAVVMHAMKSSSSEAIALSTITPVPEIRKLTADLCRYQRSRLFAKENRSQLPPVSIELSLALYYIQVGGQATSRRTNIFDRRIVIY